MRAVHNFHLGVAVIIAVEGTPRIKLLLEAGLSFLVALNETRTGTWLNTVNCLVVK